MGTLNGPIFAERKMEELISLEATYGSLPEFTPGIETVINYLHQVQTSSCWSMLNLNQSTSTVVWFSG